MTQVLKKPANGSPSAVSYYYHDQSPRASGRTGAGNSTNKYTREQRTVVKPVKLSPEKNRYGYRLHHNDSGINEDEMMIGDAEHFDGWQEKMHDQHSYNKSSLLPPQGTKLDEIKKSGHHHSKRIPNTSSYRKPPNSIALPINNDRDLHEAFERRLSNSIAVPLLNEGLSSTDKGKRSRRSKISPGRQKQKSGGAIERKYGDDSKNTAAGEGGNKDPLSSTNHSTHKGKEAYPKKTSGNDNNSADSSSADADPPTNVDETGKDAKLLAVRRIGSPPNNGDRSRESNINNSQGDSTSSSIQDGTGDAPDVFLPKRYILAIMMFMGFVNMYAVRVNLNVAIGAMANNHTVVRNGVAVTVGPEFNWSSRLQGVVLGSFYYGYMFLQIPGGYFALKFGGTKIFGLGVLLASILTLFTPVAARHSVWMLVVLRVLEGLVLGVMLPCNHQIWSSWAPLQERTTLVTIAIAGMNVGTVVTMPLTGILTKYGFDGGWSSVFYCFGLMGIVWYILWFLVVHATPATHPTISKKERQYIESNTVPRKSTTIPWCTMLSSKAVWAVVIGNVTNDWGLYTILICLPIFLMDIMKFDIQTMGFIASLPFLLKAIVGPVGGALADLLRYKYMSTTNVRRLFFAVGSISAAILIVITGYSHSPVIAVVSMCLGVAMSGLLHSGYEVNVLDIAPGLSGIVMGITNTAGTTMGFLSPLFVGFMTENKQRSEWIIVFWVTFIVYCVGTVLYCLMLSGEPQHWAVDDEDEEARDTL